MTNPPDIAHPDSRTEVVIVGRLGSRVDRRTLPSGDVVTVFTVVVDRPTSRARPLVAKRGATIDAIACQTFRVPVTRRLESMEPGTWVRVEGTLRRRFWRSPGGLGSAMEVEGDRIVRQRRS